MKKGYWQGEEVNYEVIELIVEDDLEYPLFWARVFVGDKRQAVRVTTKDGYSWVMDNEYGEALLKIYSGGWPDKSHATIKNYKQINTIDDPNEWRTEIDIEKKRHETYLIREFQKRNNPEEFEKAQRLRKLLVEKEKQKYDFLKNKN